MARLAIAAALILTGCATKTTAPSSETVTVRHRPGLPVTSRSMLRLPLASTPTPGAQRKARPPRRPFRGLSSHDLRETAAAPNWQALAACESSGDPRAVSMGRYFGLYQFDLTTWASVGGTGNPADATPAEQTYRARLLYAARGAAPWPVCGIHLQDAA